MLKQLHRKFVLINMLLVSLVLAAVFAAQLFSARQIASQEVDAALRGAITWSESGSGGWLIDPLPTPGSSQQLDKARVPTVCVILSSNGAMTAVLDNNVEVSSETLTQALTQALAADAAQGDLAGLNLRYLRGVGAGSFRIAFADLSWIRSSVGRQALTTLPVLAAALVGFFFVSLLLSKLALRPVVRSWQQQQQFVADASHELKTPLTVLLADTDILLAHPSDTIGDQRKWVEYIRDEAGRMKELVEDLLFLARGDGASGAERVHSPLNLSDLCTNCLLSFEPLAFEQGARLDSSIAPNLTVAGDEGQLRRLVAVLLDNACKYCGPAGAVTVTLERRGDRAVLSVHNTGAPIPPEALPHLFERFYRVDSARDRQSGGYGLGLPIAASIAALHQGKITVESAEGAGTRFTVSLPAQ